MSRFLGYRTLAVLGAACVCLQIVSLGVMQVWPHQTKESQDPGGHAFVAGNGDSHIGVYPTREAQRATLTKDREAKVDREEEFAVFRDVEISWRRPAMPTEGLSPPYGQKYEAYRSRALDGDANAALILYQMLEECERAFATSADMTAAVENFRQTHMLQLPVWEKPLRLRDPKQVEMMVDQVESSFNNCYPITSEQKAEKGRWLERAANGGSLLAPVWYANVADDPEKSMNAALAAWDKGAARALLIMRRHYSESYERGEDIHGNIKGFASLYAYTYLLSESRSSLSSPKVEKAMHTLEAAKASLYDYQIREATEMAKNIVESNSNCCVELF